MSNEPTAAAMCAANKIWGIIDRETGLPELLAACSQWIALCARCDAPGHGWAVIDREIEDGIAAQIEAIITEKARIA